MQLIFTVGLCSILCIEQSLFNLLLQGHHHYEITRDSQTEYAQENVSDILWS